MPGEDPAATSAEAGSAGFLRRGLTMETFRMAESALAELTGQAAGAFLSRLMVISNRVGSLPHQQA
jgi:hypothetical protein